jgi:hypothetical protein
MSSSNKRISLGWALGISLGLACSAGVVHAGSIGDSYATGGTLTATNMDNIKSAVNDNDTRTTTNSTQITNIINNTQAGTLKTEVDKITPIINNTQTGTLKTQVDKISGIETTVNNLNTTTVPDVTNLKGNLANGACVGNNASDIMVRVGNLCVDKYTAGLYVGTASTDGAATACADKEGKASCANMYAQSRLTGTRADGTTVSWGVAARACANSGKRLLTPAEWVMAWQNSNISDIVAGATPSPGVGTSEWIDAMVTATSPAKPQGGFIGQNNDQGGSIFALEFGSVAYDSVNAGWTHIHFRCVR